MNLINFITDTDGNKTGLQFNTSDKLEQWILLNWSKQPPEKREVIKLYFANFLKEISPKTEEIQTEPENIELTPTLQNIKEIKPEYVAYTISGKGLTEAEYKEHLLKLSDKAHAGIGLTPHEKVFAKYDKLKEQFANNMA